MKRRRYNPVVADLSKPMSIELYREYKMTILNRDFEVELSDEEVKHICSLNSIYQIDQYCRSILHQRWGKKNEEEE